MTETTPTSNETSIHNEKADMTNITTTAPEAATITEQELWAIFVRNAVKTTLSMGPTVDVYCPDDRLRYSGSYGTVCDFSDEVADELAHDEEPGVQLQCVIQDLSDYVEELRQVNEAFTRIKEVLAVHPDDGCADNELRFRVPVIEGNEAA